MSYDLNSIPFVGMIATICLIVLVVVDALAGFLNWKGGVKKAAVSLGGNVLALLLSLLLCKPVAGSIAGKVNLPQLLVQNGVPEAIFKSPAIIDPIDFLLLAVCCIGSFTALYLVLFILLKIPVAIVNKKVFKNEEKPSTGLKAAGAAVGVINSTLFFVFLMACVTGIVFDADKVLSRFGKETAESQFKTAAVQEYVGMAGDIQVFVSKNVTATPFFLMVENLGGKAVYKGVTKGKLYGKTATLSDAFAMISDFAVLGARAADAATVLTEAMEVMSAPAVSTGSASSPVAKAIQEAQPETAAEVIAIPEVKETLDSVATVLATSTDITTIITPETVSEILDGFGVTEADIAQMDVKEANEAISAYIDSFDGTPEELEMIKKNVNTLGSAFGITVY